MSWPLVSLSEVCKIVSGATPRTGVDEFWEDGDIWWATPKDLSAQRGMQISSTAQKITEAGYKSCSAEMLPIGSVLLSSRAPIGYVAINTVAMCTNQGFKNLVPDAKRLHNGYLYFWLRANRYYLNSLGNGATFKEISKATVARIEIPLPPLADQQRIAAILDKADALRHKRRDALAHLDRLLQSVFVEMFGDPVTNPKGWPIASLGSVCEEVYRYPTFYGFDYSEVGVPFARIGNIKANGKLDHNLANYVLVPENVSERFPRTILRINDILMAVRGDGSTAKRIGLVDSQNIVGGNISPNLLLFRARRTTTHAFYLYTLLTSPHGQALLDQHITRTAKRTITALNIKAIKVPTPPIEQQQKFAAVVEQVESLRARQIAAQTESDALFAALQARAFAGDL